VVQIRGELRGPVQERLAVVVGEWFDRAHRDCRLSATILGRGLYDSATWVAARASSAPDVQGGPAMAPQRGLQANWPLLWAQAFSSGARITGKRLAPSRVGT
jgi:hypothetical protein